ncbi:MAG: histidine phosphatase family protein [Saprospiraceae bacterium]|nr:histidine phosphatase family protein [Saprospiraceae bacterium]
MSKLYFFRHAQASYGAENYDKLSPKGELQSAELGKHLAEKQIRFDKIFVGPLERQQHTLSIVNQIYSDKNLILPTPIILPELKEHHGFQATKKVAKPNSIRSTLQNLQSEIEQNPKLHKRNSLLMFQYFIEEWAMGNIEVEGFESWKTFREKVDLALNTILKATEKSENIGIFTSGGTISAIIATALNMQDEQKVAAMNFSIRNTSFSTFFMPIINLIF